MEQNVGYDLHYFPFSLYSLITRLAFVFGEMLNPATAPNVQIKLVNLHREENLSEEYLVTVNSKGQVPALTSSALASSLADSHDIVSWLCEQQPELIPEQHREAIEGLVKKFYDFHAMALLVNAEDRKYGIPNQAAAMLERTDITDEHRRALEIKSVFHDSTSNSTLEPENIATVEAKATAFCNALDRVLEEQGQGEAPWIFGDTPTIADALATAFVARLFDTDKEAVLPEAARAWAHRAVATPEWERVTHGRGTIWNPSMGHVADLDPL